MVVAGDFKNGVTFEMDDGSVVQVIEFQHVKPGKGAAFVRTKLKNIITGAVVERSFNPTDKFENAYIERREMQYSYDDGDLYHFMDTETWEETLVAHDNVGDAFKFVKEEMMCKISSYKGKILGGKAFLPLQGKQRAPKGEPPVLQLPACAVPQNKAHHQQGRDQRKLLPKGGEQRRKIQPGKRCQQGHHAQNGGLAQNGQGVYRVKFMLQ